MYLCSTCVQVCSYVWSGVFLIVSDDDTVSVLSMADSIVECDGPNSSPKGQAPTSTN